MHASSHHCSFFTTVYIQPARRPSSTSISAGAGSIRGRKKRKNFKAATHIYISTYIVANPFLQTHHYGCSWRHEGSVVRTSRAVDTAQRRDVREEQKRLVLHFHVLVWVYGYNDSASFRALMDKTPQRYDTRELGQFFSCQPA